MTKFAGLARSESPRSAGAPATFGAQRAKMRGGAAEKSQLLERNRRKGVWVSSHGHAARSANRVEGA